jgi:hypothetical protein
MKLETARVLQFIIKYPLDHLLNHSTYSLSLTVVLILSSSSNTFVLDQHITLFCSAFISLVLSTCHANLNVHKNTTVKADGFGEKKINKFCTAMAVTIFFHIF